MTSAIERWSSLGSILPELLEQAKGDAARAWRTHLTFVLQAGGITDDEPLRTMVESLTPTERDWELDMTFGSSGIAAATGSAVERARALRSLLGIWESIDQQKEEIGDVWEAWWEEVGQLLPEIPGPAIEALSALSDEAGAIAADPASVWPMVHTGYSVAELVGKTLDDVSTRAGIPRRDLPPVPALPDEPAMVCNDVAGALHAVHDWIESREIWGRVLARLGPCFRESCSVQ